MGMPEDGGNARGFLNSLVGDTILSVTRIGVVAISSLLVTRIAISEIGVEDYGIYTVVLTIATFSSLASNSIAAVTQRSMSINVGTGNAAKFHGVFRASLRINCTYALGAFILLESAGAWCIRNIVTINLESLPVATATLHFCAGTVALGIINTSFTAALYAAGRITTVAAIGIVEAILRIGACLLLAKAQLANAATLAMYLLCVAAVTSWITYLVAAKTVKDESRLELNMKAECTELMSLSGWTLVGSAAGMANTSGSNLVVNQYFGPEVSALRNVSAQIGSVILQPAIGFQSVANSKIAAIYGRGEIHRAESFTGYASLVAVYLTGIVGIPICMEASTVTYLWLGRSDPELIEFVKLAAVGSIVEAASLPVQSLALSKGRLPRYQIVISGLSILLLPSSAYVYWSGFPAKSIYYLSIAFGLCTFLARCILVISSPLARQLGLGAMVLAKGAVACTAAILAGLFLQSLVSPGLVRLFGVAVTSMIVVVAVGLLLGLSPRGSSSRANME